MSFRNILLLLAAIFVGAGAIYFARSWLDSERAALEALRSTGDVDPEVRYILVAKKSLARGIFVKVEDLRWQAWPDEAIDENYVVKGGERKAENFAGAVVRFPVVAGEPVTSARLVRPGERGFLAAALKPGMRAVTIPVSVTTGVAGFILPGDHVDLLLTHRFGGKKSARYATETLMPDVRVIAIDQHLNLEKKQGVKVSKTLTFEVTPKEVEMVTVARRIGSMSLSLRSLAEPELVADVVVDAGTGIAANDVVPVARGRGYTWGDEVSLLLTTQAKKTVMIVRGGSRQAVAANPSKTAEDETAVADGEGDDDEDDEAESGDLEDPVRVGE